MKKSTTRIDFYGTVDGCGADNLRQAAEARNRSPTELLSELIQFVVGDADGSLIDAVMDDGVVS